MNKPTSDINMKTIHQIAKEFAIEHGAVDALFVGIVEGCPVYEAIRKSHGGKEGGTSLISFDKDKNPIIVDREDTLQLYAMAVRSQ